MTPYTPEESAYANEVARFLRKEVDPRSRQIEEEDAIPEELMKLAREVQIHGGVGYMREAGIETTFRDARIVRIYEGSSEIQRNIIGGLLLK